MMLFGDIIDNVVIDYQSFAQNDWYIDDQTGYLNLKIIGLEKPAYRFFNIDPYDVDEMDTIMDTVAIIDMVKHRVVSIEYLLMRDGGYSTEDTTYLTISLENNKDTGTTLYDTIMCSAKKYEIFDELSEKIHNIFEK